MTPEQRAGYEDRGYVIVRGLFEKHELEPWLERLRAIAEGVVKPAPGMTVMRDVMVAKGVVAPETPLQAVAKLQDFHEDPVLFAYVTDPRMLDWAEAFVGPDVKAIHNMLISKPPGVDGRHPLHQDLLYFPFRPAEAIVGAWTALEPSTRENGCLVAVPGTHRGALLPHQNPDWEYLNFAYFGAVGVGAETERVHLEMDPGDTVFFHPLLLHGSGRNRTAGFRRAISTHYASARCRFIAGAEPLGNRRPYTLVRGRDHPDCI